MTLWRKTTRYYSDEAELEGLRKALANRIDSEVRNNEDDGEAFPYYAGAAIMLDLMLGHDEFRDQLSLMSLFDETLRQEGIALQIDSYTE